MRQKGTRRSRKVKKLNTDDTGSESEYVNEDSMEYAYNDEESSDGVCTGEEDGSESRAMRELVLQQNRKKKKSGGFQSMGLSFPVFKGIMKKGYRVPTPIQRKTIPLIMDGKDIVAMARTGSGKTAAFLVPMFERLKCHSAKIGARAIVLSPTRELAQQTMKFTKELGKFTDLRASIVLGGDKMEDQFAAIHENPDIIVATPGRFLHLLVEMELKMSAVEYVVFDEADRLFEMGFSEQLHEIIRRFPESRQTLLFSATLPKLLVEFAKAGLKEPVLIRLDVDSKLSDQLRLAFLSCRADDKPAVLLHLLHNVIPESEQTLVFVATKHHVEYLRELLEVAGIHSSAVYSSLDQTARKINIGKFIHKKTSILLVTDVAARGIDIPMLDNVINYNFPSKPKLFVHRVGRVARAGRSGSSFSLVSPDEIAYMFDLHLFIGRDLKFTGKDGVYGRVPQMVVDEEEDFLRFAHSSNCDLAALKTVAENGLKQYIRSRNPPSPESIKRSKDLPPVLSIHPLFEKLCSQSQLRKSQLLDSLKSYKPSQTIFEVNATAKGQAKQIMASKRKLHSRLVLATRGSHQTVPTTLGGTGGGQLTWDHCSNQQPSSGEDLSVFGTKKYTEKKGKVKSEHYIKYTATDHYTERGLSLDKMGSSFERQAAHVGFDLEGDELQDLKKSKTTLKWDRKRKRFVNESGKGTVKKIRTESGALIPATYQAGLYKQWKSQQRIEGVFAGSESDIAMAPRPSLVGSRSKLGQGGKGKRGKSGRSGRKQDGRIKSVSEILKQRQKKDFSRQRRQANQRKKLHSGHTRKH